jgi:hypothetical protein
MLALTKPDTDFSVGCAGKRIGPLLFATLPAALPFANVSMPAPRTEILTAVNRGSLHNTLCLGISHRARR